MTTRFDEASRPGRPPEPLTAAQLGEWYGIISSTVVPEWPRSLRQRVRDTFAATLFVGVVVVLGLLFVGVLLAFGAAVAKARS